MTYGLTVLVPEGLHKESSAPFFRSLEVDVEKMRPGHWLGSCFEFA